MHGLVGQLSSLDPTTRWVVIALAVLTMVYALMRPKFRRRDPLEKPPPSSLAQQRAVEREMSNLLVELSEMTRQLNAQLDTRATKLELLIRDADARIAELRSLATAAGSVSAASALAVASAPIEIDPRHAEVYLLADQGRSPPEIANQLGRPNGEVELILALRPS